MNDVEGEEFTSSYRIIVSSSHFQCEDDGA